MKIEPKALRDTNRIKLWEHVPLPAPLVVYLEPASLCNLRCNYCPTGHKGLRRLRPNGVMDFGLFVDIVDGFKELPAQVRRFNLYKDGEPLLNDRFCDMVEYLAISNVTEQIWTKTNGLLLNDDTIDDLSGVPLDLLSISLVHPSSAGYRDLADVHIDYSQLRDNISEMFYRSREYQLHVSLRDTGLSGAEKMKFFADFEDICDHMAIEGLHGWSASDTFDFRMGTDESFDGTPIVDKQVCPLTLCALGINWNGTVSPCNEDWKHAHIIGDLNTQSVSDIWNGGALHDFRMAHLEGRRGELEMCADCQYMTCLPDNVDGHIEEIIGRLNDETDR